MDEGKKLERDSRRTQDRLDELFHRQNGGDFMRFAICIEMLRLPKFNFFQFDDFIVSHDQHDFMHMTKLIQF